MRISDWSSDVCSSDLRAVDQAQVESRGILLVKANIGDAGNSEISDGIDAQCDPEAAGDERKCGDHVFDILDDARGNAALVQHPEKIVAEAAGPLAGRVENERLLVRSEERRVGKGGVSTCRCRWLPS